MLLGLNWPASSARRGTGLACAALSVATLALLYYSFPFSQAQFPFTNTEFEFFPATDGLQAENSTIPAPYAQIGKASMLYGYGELQPLYDRALATHARHAAHHGYTLDILRREVADGYWSKTFYLISLLISQLARPSEERLQWIMWFDADSIIINQEIPVHIFLPPSPHDQFDDVHFVFARDDWGMNSGVFFVRVHMRSVHILARAVAYPTCHPGEDLGRAYDQHVLELTLREPEFTRQVMWVPRTWFNAMHAEIIPGSMCAHFYSDFVRQQHLEEWLNELENGNNPGWQISYEQSFYPPEIDEFWSTVGECRHLLKMAEDFTVEDTARESFQLSLQRLENCCITQQDNIVELISVIREVKSVMNPQR